MEKPLALQGIPDDEMRGILGRVKREGIIGAVEEEFITPENVTDPRLSEALAEFKAAGQKINNILDEYEGYLDEKGLSHGEVDSQLFKGAGR